MDLLVRPSHNRGIIDEPFKLFEAVRQAPLQTKVQVHVPHQSARPKLSKRKARPKRPSRQANMEVRCQRIQLRPPKYHSGVGGGEKGYQFGGREGATCGVTLWPAVGRRKREEADCFLSQAGLSSLLTSGVR